VNAKRFVEHLCSGRHYSGQVVHEEVLAPKPARYAATTRPLHTEIQRALVAMGIERLYTHQAEAVDAARAGENVVVVTGTASGKTLCYNIPVIESLLTQSGSRALYLFPTKALAQDQLRGLLRFKEVCPDLPLLAGTYDGDTPSSTRRRLRDRGNCVLTNPDMLHSGILPNHAGWTDFFASLQWVVIDELHTYRGIFGSNVANVIRRLKRICAHHGAHPRFLCSSATIANPGELAFNLTGDHFRVVDDDGSARGPKHFVLWNPPTIGETMERRSPQAEAVEIMVRLVQDRVPTIAFTRARVVTELLYRYVREQLQRVSPSLANAVRAYRGGYLPSDRREIERQLFAGELLGVTSTNALELGIDIGNLDACLIVGYPGSIASTWQQAGRAGRGQEEALVVLLGHNAPLDQYLMQHPTYFFGQSCENAIVDADNPHVVLNHLRTAIFELPLPIAKERQFGSFAPALLDLLAEDGQITRRGNAWYWVGGGYPAEDFSLRNACDNSYTIVDTTSGQNRVIGSLDELSAFTQLHAEAIYLHGAETHSVSRLDLSERVAYVHRAEVDYYTQAISDRRVRVESEQVQKEWRGSKVSFGDVGVTFITYMFKKVKFGSRDSIGFGKIDLPPVTLDTCAMWLSAPMAAFSAVSTAGLSPLEGLVGVANVMVEVLPLFAMCDPSDIDALVDSSNTGVPTIFLFDRYPGGAGFAQKAYEMVEEVLAACCELIWGCECTEGCPSCVGAPVPLLGGEVAGDTKGKVPDKEAALVILHALLERPPYIPRRSSPHPLQMQPGVAGTGHQDAPLVEPLVERERPAPLPENTERRLRRQMQRLKVARSIDSR
jgi:DEAD/DEAH box helicase domain-containing protein